MIKLEEIREIVKGEILINEPLAKYSTFKIGGPATPIPYFNLISSASISALRITGILRLIAS